MGNYHRKEIERKQARKNTQQGSRAESWSLYSWGEKEIDSKQENDERTTTKPRQTRIQAQYLWDDSHRMWMGWWKRESGLRRALRGPCVRGSLTEAWGFTGLVCWGAWTLHLLLHVHKKERKREREMGKIIGEKKREGREIGKNIGEKERNVSGK